MLAPSFLSLALLWTCVSPARPEPSQPNVLFMVVDGEAATALAGRRCRSDS